MAAIVAVAEEVKHFWLSQGLKVHSVGADELIALRRTLGGTIPTEYEAFLRIAGLPDDEDKSGIRFWQPLEVRIMRSAIHDSSASLVAGEQIALIADYFQESWSYGIWLSGPLAGSVSVVPSPTSGWVAHPVGTMAEFLTAYVAGDPRVYSY